MCYICESRHPSQAQSYNITLEPLPSAILMLTALRLINLALAAVVAAPQGLWVIEPEVLHEERRGDGGVKKLLWKSHVRQNISLQASFQERLQGTHKSTTYSL